MKKIFLVLSLFLALISPLKTNSMTFEDAFDEVYSKPMMVLIYADWANEYQKCLNQFYELEDEYGNIFNFVTLNIASEDAKHFNKKYVIERNLPYAIMLRDGGKVVRYLYTDCILNDSCIASRIKSFIQ